MTAGTFGLGVVAGETGTRLVVTEAAAGLRRALGPTAWCALEVLVVSARRDSDGALVAAVGVRDLAALLGVGRDAAAGALQVLRARGLVVFDERRGEAGRFSAARYVIRVPVSAESDTEVGTRRSRRSARPLDAPTLFDPPAPPALTATTRPPAPDRTVTRAAPLEQTVHRPSSNPLPPFSQIPHEFALGMPDGPAGVGC